MLESDRHGNEKESGRDEVGDPIDRERSVEDDDHAAHEDHVPSVRVHLAENDNIKHFTLYLKKIYNKNCSTYSLTFYILCTL